MNPGYVHKRAGTRSYIVGNNKLAKSINFDKQVIYCTWSVFSFETNYSSLKSMFYLCTNQILKDRAEFVTNFK